MTTSEKQLIRFGGLVFISAGVLFLVANLLIAMLPDPPSLEAEFSKWLSENKINIASQNEFLFFATISLIPSVYVLYHLLKNRFTRSALVGLGLMVLVIPILAVLVIVEGRLVYPVYSISLSVETLKLVLSIYYGGMHAVSLLLAGAIIFISYALRNTVFPQAHWYLGVITGVSQIVGSFPWIIKLAGNLVVIILFSVWLILTGVTILQKAGQLGFAAVKPTRAG